MGKENENLDKKEFNLKDSEYFKFVVQNFITIMIGIIFLQLSVLMGQLIFKKSSLLLIGLIVVIPLFLFMVVKDSVDSKNKSKTKYLKIFLFFIVTLTFNHFVLDFFATLTKGVPGPIANIIYMFDFGIIIAFVGLEGQDFYKEVIDNVMKINILEKFNQEDTKEEIKPGDAVIGYKLDEYGEKTNIPVILPAKDRFLHMLILGPTGCGKTSQSLIPMINRDMGCKEIGITVLEPKGDLAEKIFAMAKYYGREVVYFNPILPDCPYFNPLYGDESDVVENLATTFNMLNPDSPQFFKDMSEGLIRKSTKMLKRLYGDDATLIDLNTLVWDTGGQGRKMVMEFSRKIDPRPEIQKENEEIYQWFLNDYYSGLSGARGSTKTYEHCSGVRSQISKLVSNEYLRKVLNPPKGHGSDLDFDDALERGIVITIGTAQGKLRDLGRFLGYFIILQLQASVFRRPGNEFTRKYNMLFIDEFQVYTNPGFADMLTMGRSYRVASHLATQARDQIAMGGGKDGKNFVQLVSTNARNKIIYPGISSADAKYYSEEFGEAVVQKIGKTFAKKRFLSTLSEERVSTSIKEEKEARFSLSDIIYKGFGIITYCIIKNNSVTTPGVSQIQYIPKDLNDELDRMVADYNKEQEEKEAKLKAIINKSLNEENNNTAFNLHKDGVVKETLDNSFLDPITTIDEEIIEDEDKPFSYQNENGDTFNDVEIGNDICIEEEIDDII